MLQNERAEARYAAEYKLILAQLEAVRAATDEESEEAKVSTATRLADTIESGRLMVASATKVCKFLGVAGFEGDDVDRSRLSSSSSSSGSQPREVVSGRGSSPGGNRRKAWLSSLKMAIPPKAFANPVTALRRGGRGGVLKRV